VHCGSLLPMKPAHYTALMATLFPWIVSCGGGTLTLAVLPSSTTLDPTPLIPLPYVQLQAKLSNGTLPTGVQWTSSAACIPVNKTGQVNCNITCDGVIESHVVASADGQTASATVTCNYHTSASVQPDEAVDRNDQPSELH
jgi:hypothetical protein